jgi:hypothetical protein
MAVPLVIGFMFFGLVVVATVVAATRAGKRASGGATTPLAQELGVPSTFPLVVERHGRTFTVTYIPGGKNTPPSLRIAASVDEVGATGALGAYRESGRDHVDVRPAILLRRETGLDRFGKRIGLNREVQIGDEELDALAYVETDSPDDDVRRTLADDRARRAVRELIREGVTRVQLDPSGLSADRAVRSAADMSAASFEHTAALLAEAASALPVFTAGRAAKARSALTGVLAMVGAGMIMPVLMIAAGKSPIDPGAKQLGAAGGLGLWLLIVVGLVVTLSGRSTSLRRVALSSLAALLIVPVGFYSALCWTNRELDESPRVDHATTVTRVWTSRGKNTTYYHVDVASWRADMGTITLDVSSSFANGAQKGSKIVVSTHAGKLGWEWVEAFKLTP